MGYFKNAGKVPIFQRYKILHGVNVRIFHLADDKIITFSISLFFHLFQKSFQSRLIQGSVFHRNQTVRSVCRKRGQPFFFLHICNRIQPETADSQIQPVVHHAVHFFSEPGIVPVQIHLFFCKKMKIIVFASRNLFPGTSPEDGAPVIRRIFAFSFSQEKIIRVFALGILQNLLKPLMLIRTVI